MCLSSYIHILKLKNRSDSGPKEFGSVEWLTSQITILLLMTLIGIWSHLLKTFPWFVDTCVFIYSTALLMNPLEHPPQNFFFQFYIYIEYLLKNNVPKIFEILKNLAKYILDSFLWVKIQTGRASKDIFYDFNKANLRKRNETNKKVLMPFKSVWISFPMHMNFYFTIGKICLNLILVVAITHSVCSFAFLLQICSCKEVLV